MSTDRYENNKPKTDNLILAADQPLDDLAAHQMQTIARKGRGFVLDLAAGRSDELKAVRERLAVVAATVGTGKKSAGDVAELVDEIDRALADAADVFASPTIEVRESLPPHDEWLPRVADRNHELRDTTSFIAYATRYGTKARSLVLYSDEKFTLVLDEDLERGTREVATMPVITSDDWDAWTAVINKPTDHKALVEHLMKQEHNLAEGGVLAAMQSLRLGSTINLESDVTENENNFSVAVKTRAGDQMKSFPKKFAINLPVLKQDVDGDVLTPATIRLTIVLPKVALESPTFTLYCSAWEQILIKRVEKEGDLIQAGLPDWTVVHGVYRTAGR